MIRVPYESDTYDTKNRFSDLAICTSHLRKGVILQKYLRSGPPPPTPGGGSVRDLGYSIKNPFFRAPAARYMYFFVLKYLRNFVLKYLRNSTFLLKYLRSGPPPLTPGGVRYGVPKITLFLKNLSPMLTLVLIKYAYYFKRKRLQDSSRFFRRANKEMCQKEVSEGLFCRNQPNHQDKPGSLKEIQRVLVSYSLSISVFSSIGKSAFSPVFLPFLRKCFSDPRSS